MFARVDAGRQRFLHLGQRALDRARELHGVGARLLLDREDHRRRALISGIAALHARGELDVRDLAQHDGLALPHGDDEIAQILDAIGQADVADQEFARVLIDEAAAGVGAEAAQARLRACRA